MKYSLKQILSLSVALMIMLGLTACGSKNQSPVAISGGESSAEGGKTDMNVTETPGAVATDEVGNTITTVEPTAGKSTMGGNKATTTSTTASSKGTATSTIANKENPITIDKAKAIQITTQKNKVRFQSNFTFGTTQTHYSWQNGNPIATMKAMQLLRNVSSINNQHICAFGSGYLQEHQGAKTDFKSLDSMVQRMKSLGGTQMLTLCSAPGWMLVSNPADKYDAESRVKEEYFDDYAALCSEVAKRYTEVNMFQVWNEFKGFWNSRTNWWDVDLYIKFYNKVYDAVKKARPDAKIGGFYMSSRGDNANALLGGNYGEDSFDPVNPKADPMGGNFWDSLSQWMEQAHGFDYVCFDKGIQGYRNTEKLTEAQALTLCQTYQTVLNKLCSMTNKPIILSEYYGLRPAKAKEKLTEEFQAAEFASIYTYIMEGAKSRDITALLWMEKADEGVGLFTDTNNAKGGIATAYYTVTEGFTTYFNKGKSIVTSNSASSDIQVLASSQKTMVINKTDAEQLIYYAGQYRQLLPYEVCFLDTVQ